MGKRKLRLVILAFKEKGCKRKEKKPRVPSMTGLKITVAINRRGSKKIVAGGGDLFMKGLRQTLEHLPTQHVESLLGEEGFSLPVRPGVGVAVESEEVAEGILTVKRMPVAAPL